MMIIAGDLSDLGRVVNNRKLFLKLLIPNKQINIIIRIIIRESGIIKTVLWTEYLLKFLHCLFHF